MMIKQCNDSIYTIEIYAYWTSKNLVSDKEVIKCNNIKSHIKND